jgi:multicomponent Na+:H+ antiporter subunit C
MQRLLSRIIIGIGLIGHGANVVLLASGGAGGRPAFIDGRTAVFSDPLPQSFILTAIVISFGVTAFLLALAYRSWVQTADDLVEDDIEDRLIAREGAVDEDVGDDRALGAAQAAEEAAR